MSFYATRTFRELQTEWYRKLHDVGFRDVEVQQTRDGLLSGELRRGKTLRNSISYFDGITTRDGTGRVPRGREISRRTDDIAEHWRWVAREVAELPPQYPFRAFLEAWAQSGEVFRTAEALGLSRHQGRVAVQRFNVLLKRKRRMR